MMFNVRRKVNMFSENLKVLRKEKGFSQEQLAAQLNVVRQTVSKWEKGLSVPDAELLEKLAEVLEVSVGELLGKNIEIKSNSNEIETLALELAKLNELLVVYGNKLSNLKKQIYTIIGIVLVVILACVLFEPMMDISYRFGQNLYHMMND